MKQCDSYTKFVNFGLTFITNEILGLRVTMFAWRCFVNISYIFVWKFSAYVKSTFLIFYELSTRCLFECLTDLLFKAICTGISRHCAYRERLVCRLFFMLVLL
jgi:hypothetical protein